MVHALRSRRRATSCGRSPRQAARRFVAGHRRRSRVFVGSADGRLYALGSGKTGEKVWEYEAGGDFAGSPAVAAGRLVIGNDDGTLYCFGEATKAALEAAATWTVDRCSFGTQETVRMATEATKTEVGSYFIANYPPFSQWTRRGAGRGARGIDARRAAGATCRLGLYLHIPFCRKRCKFCYFRVYTDKNAGDVETLRRGPVARDRAGQPAAGDGRPAVPLRLLRRRHAVVPERQAAHVAGRSAAGQHQLGPGRGSHLRVRAGHALASRRSHTLKRAGRHAAQPGRREFRRRGARRERPGASLGRGLQGVGLDPRRRLSQHRTST